MARFIITDLTDPSSTPKELELIVPQLAVPVQPLREGSSRSYAMLKETANAISVDVHGTGPTDNCEREDGQPSARPKYLDKDIDFL
jgi:hypothetical protein